jgi:alpha-glucosidase
MPWNKDFENGPMYKLYSTMAHLKAEHKALRSGGMKFLYAKDGIVSLARFCGDEAFVSVMSTNDEDKTVRLPLGAIGASGFKGDVFGDALDYRILDDNAVALTVPAHRAYMMECLLK